MSLPWRECTFVGFDVETSGKYPLDAEICEIAAVKWQGGKIVDQMQTFVAIKRPMGAEVIAIHHITNDMLIGAPSVATAMRQFNHFIEGSYLIAHHAQFDLGFIAPEFERIGIILPKNLVLCTSLLSRKAFSDSPNHKLQTLIDYFKLERGQAHRALDDAKACLEVALRCFPKVSEEATIEQVLNYQSIVLDWQKFSIADFKAHPVLKTVVEALEKRTPLQIVYDGGSRPGEARTVYPMGIVRNPQDDFFVAMDESQKNEKDAQPKRYFLKRISAARL